MGEHYRRRRRGGEGDGRLRSGRRLGAGGQGAEGGGHGLDDLVGIDVPDHHQLDRRIGQLRRQQGLHLVRGLGGDLGAAGQAPAGIAPVQKAGQIAAQDAARGRAQLIEEGRGRPMHPLERLGPPAGVDDIGRQQLQLGVQVVRPGNALKGEGVVVHRELAADDLGAQHLVQVLGRQLVKAAFGEGRGRGPGGGRPVLGQVLAPAADARLHQHLVGAELGRLDGQPHPVGEAHEGGVQIGRLGALGDVPRGSEVLIGPAHRLAHGRGRDRRGLRGGEGRRDDRLPAVDGCGGGHEHQGPRAGEGGGDGLVDLRRRQPLHGRIEQRQVLRRAGLHLRGRQGADDVFRDAGGGAGGFAVGGRFQRGAIGVDLLAEFGGGDAVFHQSAGLGVGRGQGLAPFAAPGGGLQGQDPGGMELRRRIGAGADEGRILRPDPAVQAPVQHRQAQGLEGVAAAPGLAVRRAVGRRDPGELHHLRGARLHHQPHGGAAMQGRAEIGVGSGRSRPGPVAEAGLDPGLHGVGIEVADGDQHRPLRPVVGAVEVADLRPGGVLDHLDLADGEALGRPLALQGEAQVLLQHPVAGGVAQALLAEHHPLFLVDGGLVQGQLAGNFPEQHQRGVDGVVVGSRQVQLVDGLLPGG